MMSKEDTNWRKGHTLVAALRTKGTCLAIVSREINRLQAAGIAKRMAIMRKVREKRQFMSRVLQVWLFSIDRTTRR